MTPSMTDSAVKAAMTVIASSPATTQEKIEMLIEMAQGFQKKPKSAQDLWNAVSLCQQAHDLCSEDNLLWQARAKTGMAGALKAIPDVGEQLLLEARTAYEEALPILQQSAPPEEVAEAQMNVGLVLQSLVPFNLARMTDSIQAYHKALQVFTWQKYPQEYAILHNNIAIAYLSMPMTSEKEYLRQGLAVQTFEEALKHIRLINHPREYAMLQNNLGNALQYLASSHPLENILRAIAAYDEALKVRNPKDTPLEYANTISNKANALFNLPDNPEKPESGNIKNLLQARTYYQEAWEIFSQHGQIEQAEVITLMLQEIETEIGHVM
jgi:tetratricopeptide (TPR) repeat protein